MVAPLENQDFLEKLLWFIEKYEKRGETSFPG